MNKYSEKEKNIFNSVDKEQLTQLLILPNEFDFNLLKEKKMNNIE